MTHDEFLAEVTRYYNAVTDQRYGQAFFNVLHIHRPDISEKIRGTYLDPFYVGVDVECWLFVHDNW